MTPRRIAVAMVQAALTPDLLKPEYRAANRRNPLFGHCYAASEALFHLLGGKASGYVPMRAKDHRGVTHWWLLHKPSGETVDPTAGQYHSVGERPPHAAGVGGGFLTAKPSRRAATIIARVRQAH